MPRRRGKSLIEMVVVMAAMSLVLGLAIQTLHTLLRAERSGTQALAESVTVSRLARRFRHDVHAAGQIKVVPAADAQPAQLRLTLPDDTALIWSAGDEQITRSRRVDDETTARELYRIGPGEYRFERSADGAVVALVIEPPATPSTRAAFQRTNVSRKPLRIEAVAGRDLRFAQDEPSDED